MARRLNILITGCNGFIGKHLAAALAYHPELKCHITGVDPNELESIVPTPIIDNFQKCDAGSYMKLLNDGHQLRNLFPEKVTYDVIIHLGTISRGPIFDKYPEDSISSDTLALLSILSYCRFHPETKLVYLSTMSAGLSTKPIHTLKLNAECLITSYIQRYGVNAAVVKVDKVFGPGENDFDEFNSLLRVCKKAKLENRIVTVFGESDVTANGGVGTQRNDWIHVTKLTEGIISVIKDHLLVHRKPFIKTFQIFSGIVRSVDEIAWAFKPDFVEYDPKRLVRRIREPVYDPNLLPYELSRQRDLGIPNIDVIEYIEAWLEDNVPS